MTTFDGDWYRGSPFSVRTADANDESRQRHDEIKGEYILQCKHVFRIFFSSLRFRFAVLFMPPFANIPFFRKLTIPTRIPAIGLIFSVVRNVVRPPSSASSSSSSSSSFVVRVKINLPILNNSHEITNAVTQHRGNEINHRQELIFRNFNQLSMEFPIEFFGIIFSSFVCFSSQNSLCPTMRNGHRVEITLIRLGISFLMEGPSCRWATAIYQLSLANWWSIYYFHLLFKELMWFASLLIRNTQNWYFPIAVGARREASICVEFVWMMMVH